MRISTPLQALDPFPSCSQTSSSRWPALLLLSLCFGIGWAMLFVQVTTTTIAVKQWMGTQYGTLPYGVLVFTQTLWCIPSKLIMRGRGGGPISRAALSPLLSFLLRRRRKLSFLFGALCGAIGSAVLLLAVPVVNGEKSGRFPLPSSSPSFSLLLLTLCLGSALCGIANTYVNFLRFEGGTFLPPSQFHIASSVIIAGGILGGGAGPILSRFSKGLRMFGLFRKEDYFATYFLSVCLWLLQLLLLCFIPFTRSEDAPEMSREEKGEIATLAEVNKFSDFSTRSDKKDSELFTKETLSDEVEKGEEGEEGRKSDKAMHALQLTPPLDSRSLLSLPIAIFSSTLSYTSMAIFMMTTILTMSAVQRRAAPAPSSSPPSSSSLFVDFSLPSNRVYSFDDAANVVLAHVEAMFVPSLFSGLLITRLGANLVSFLGFLLMVLAEFLLLLSLSPPLFFALCLVGVGVGWNLSFVAATALVGREVKAHPESKDWIEGLNDCVMFGVNTALAGSSSVILQEMGDWDAFIWLYACLSVPGIVVSMLFWLARK